MQRTRGSTDTVLPLASMTATRQNADMAGKQKVTLYIDGEVLQAARVRAARTEKRDSDVVEAALRAYLGFDLLERIWARNADVTEEEAMQLAVEETRAVRRERAARGS